MHSVKVIEHKSKKFYVEARYFTFPCRVYTQVLKCVLRGVTKLFCKIYFVLQFQLAFQKRFKN